MEFLIEKCVCRLWKVKRKSKNCHCQDDPDISKEGSSFICRDTFLELSFSQFATKNKTKYKSYNWEKNKILNNSLQAWKKKKCRINSKTFLWGICTNSRQFNAHEFLICFWFVSRLQTLAISSFIWFSQNILVCSFFFISFDSFSFAHSSPAPSAHLPRTPPPHTYPRTSPRMHT